MMRHLITCNLISVLIIASVAGATEPGQVKGVARHPTGKPFAGARVRLVRLHASKEIEYTATANTDGEFKFTAVDAGKFVLAIEENLFPPEERLFRPRLHLTDPSHAGVFEVREGATVVREIRSPHRAKLFLQVARGGKPLATKRAYLMPLDASGYALPVGELVVPSDHQEAGAYSRATWPVIEGLYAIRFTLNGYRVYCGQLSIVRSDDVSRRVAVGDRSVQVTISDDKNRPVRSASIRLIGRSNWTRVVPTAGSEQTSKDGVYTVPFAIVGEHYTVWAQRGTHRVRGPTILVKADEPTACHVKIGATGRLNVKLLGSPRPGAPAPFVRAWRPGIAPFVVAQLDSQGIARLDWMVAGNWQIDCTDSKGVVISSARVVKIRANQTHEIELKRTAGHR